MASIEAPRDLFVNELKGMLYVEQKQADEVLPQLAKEITNQEFKQGIQRHIDETKRHVANVERAFELMGEEAKADKNHAIDGLVAQHEKIVKNIGSDQLRDVFDAGAAAKTEHLEIAAYESMITSAEALGESEIVSLLEENLDQERETLKQIKTLSEQLAKAGATI